jgi:vacuolar-type H+-ATPase subunit I/STV1
MFGEWDVIKVEIIVMMEGMYEFIKKIRMKWVELMRKFYEGKGYIFKKF